MQFPVSVKIEPSKSGKTFGIAICKEDKPLLVVKGCKLVDGNNGQFVSGPSTKLDDGWFNYLFMDKDFGSYVTGLAQKAVSAPKKSAPVDDDMPF